MSRISAQGMLPKWFRYMVVFICFAQHMFHTSSNILFKLFNISFHPIFVLTPENQTLFGVKAQISVLHKAWV